MNRFLDKKVDALLVVLAGKNKVNSSLASYLNKGYKSALVLSIFLFVPFLIVSIFLSKNFDNKWWSLIPIFLYVVILFFFVTMRRINDRIRIEKLKSKNDLTEFNLDLNTMVFKKLFGYLTKYEHVDEELTSFQDFYNVMTLDFANHGTMVHFDMNLAELKYLLDKIKKLRKGLTLTSFEHSNKIYNRGKFITQKALTSAYGDNVPDKEFRDHVDYFFEFLTDI